MIRKNWCSYQTSHRTRPCLLLFTSHKKGSTKQIFDKLRNGSWGDTEPKLTNETSLNERRRLSASRPHSHAWGNREGARQRRRQGDSDIYPLFQLCGLKLRKNISYSTDSNPFFLQSVRFHSSVSSVTFLTTNRSVYLHQNWCTLFKWSPVGRHTMYLFIHVLGMAHADQQLCWVYCSGTILKSVWLVSCWLW